MNESEREERALNRLWVLAPLHRELQLLFRVPELLGEPNEIASTARAAEMRELQATADRGLDRLSPLERDAYARALAHHTRAWKRDLVSECRNELVVRGWSLVDDGQAHHPVHGAMLEAEALALVVASDIVEHMNEPSLTTASTTDELAAAARRALLEHEQLERQHEVRGVVERALVRELVVEA